MPQINKPPPIHLAGGILNLLILKIKYLMFLQNLNTVIPQGLLCGKQLPLTASEKEVNSAFAQYDWAVQIAENLYIIVNRTKTKVLRYQYREEELTEDFFKKCLKVQFADFLEARSYNYFEEGQSAPSPYVDKVFKMIGLDEKEWNAIRRFTLEELFKCENTELKTKLFAGVSAREMIAALPHKELKTESFRGIDYTLLKIKVSDLIKEDSRQDAYAYLVRCKCPSTGETHYLWVKEEFISDPITAIASCAVIQEDLVPHVKAIKRQGDVFILGLPADLNVEIIDDKKPKRHLTKAEYKTLLVEES